MPNIPFPDKRVVEEKKEITIDDTPCKMVVFSEYNSFFFGLLEWKGRHVRVDIPVETASGPRLKLVHDHRGRYLGGYWNDLAEKNQHIHDTIQEAEEWLLAWKREEVTLSRLYSIPAEESP